MRRAGSGAWLALAAALWLAAPAGAGDANDPLVTQGGTRARWLEALPTWEVVVDTGESRHAFQAWVARTPWQKVRGLMHVRSLDPERGMLFLLGHPEYASFWMRDTYVSLDLLFIDEQGRIVNIIERAEPLTTMPLLSTAPVTHVLEILAGTSERLGIRAGHRVEIGEPAAE
jgi:uncharacterized membrane protein (UPF0127 family)